MDVEPKLVCETCEGAGFCVRHSMHKTEQLAKLCRTRPDYKQIFDEGRWPGQPEWNVQMPSRGLGDTVAKITSAVGIKPCGGCKERQVLLNRVLPYVK